MNQSILINDDKTYRGIRFHDYDVGTKLIGAASIESIQKVDNHTLALASSRPLINQKAGLYGVLANKANFDGNLVVLVFDPNVQARVIEGDIIAFKGTVAPSDVLLIQTQQLIKLKSYQLYMFILSSWRTINTRY